jgi:hypothetical protein
MDMAKLSEKEAIQWKALQEEIYIQRRAYHPATWPTETSENKLLERPTNAAVGFYGLVFYMAI